MPFDFGGRRGARWEVSSVEPSPPARQGSRQRASAGSYRWRCFGMLACLIKHRRARPDRPKQVRSDRRRAPRPPARGAAARRPPVRRPARGAWQCRWCTSWTTTRRSPLPSASIGERRGVVHAQERVARCRRHSSMSCGIVVASALDDDVLRAARSRTARRLRRKPRSPVRRNGPVPWPSSRGVRRRGRPPPREGNRR